MKRKLALVLAAAASAAVFVAGTVAGVVTASPPCWAGHGGDKSCAATTTGATTTAPATTTTTTTPAASYLFDDEFNGAAGAQPDSAKWYNLGDTSITGWIPGGFGTTTKPKYGNAFLNGNGQLDLRITREPWYGKSYASAAIATYFYGTGWPTPTQYIKEKWTLPFRYEVRVMYPNVAGSWDSPGWIQTIDRPTSQYMYELDLGESRTTYPTILGYHQHRWLNGADTLAFDHDTTVSDIRTNWHTLTLDVTTAGDTLYIDGVQQANAWGPDGGGMGVIVHNGIGDAGSWGSGGQQPDPNDPGPWDMLVDYVRVTSL